MFHVKQTCISPYFMDTSIFLQVGVKIFLKNKQGFYLLLRRSAEKYPNIKNFWDIPGGRIFPGTPLFENIQREVHEETELVVTGTLKLICAQDIIRGEEKHIVRLTYTGEANGNPVLNEEHIEFRWLTLKSMLEIKELDEFTREVIESGLVL